MFAELLFLGFQFPIEDHHYLLSPHEQIITGELWIDFG
jgi:hypothetical protein